MSKLEISLLHKSASAPTQDPGKTLPLVLGQGSIAEKPSSQQPQVPEPEYLVRVWTPALAPGRAPLAVPGTCLPAASARPQEPSFQSASAGHSGPSPSHRPGFLCLLALHSLQLPRQTQVFRSSGLGFQLAGRRWAHLEAVVPLISVFCSFIHETK